jgi:hypothetical protein
VSKLQPCSIYSKISLDVSQKRPHHHLTGSLTISRDLPRREIFEDVMHVAPQKACFLKDIERSDSSLIFSQFLARSFKISEDVVQKGLYLYMKTLLSSKDLHSIYCIYNNLYFIFYAALLDELQGFKSHLKSA